MEHVTCTCSYSVFILPPQNCMTLLGKDNRACSPTVALFVNTLSKQVVLYLALHHLCEHFHSSERKPHLPYVMDVSTPILNKSSFILRWPCAFHRRLSPIANPYLRQETLLAVCCWCGVTHIFSKSSVIFSHTLYLSVTARMPVWKSAENMDVGTPTTYGQVYFLEHLYQDHGCMDTYK